MLHKKKPASSLAIQLSIQLAISLSKQRIGRRTTCGGDKKEASFVYGVVREKET